MVTGVWEHISGVKLTRLQLWLWDGRSVSAVEICIVSISRLRFFGLWVVLHQLQARLCLWKQCLLGQCKALCSCLEATLGLTVLIHRHTPSPSFLKEKGPVFVGFQDL